MKKTKTISSIGVLSALAILLYFFEFPIFTLFPPYLKVDLSDIPAILGGIAAGPLAGVLIELIKNIIHFFIKGNTPFASGEIGNFFAGIGLLIPIAVIIRKKRKNSLLAYVLGAVLMVIIANLSNYFITLPLYGIPKEAWMPTIIYTLIPFNLVKAAIVSVVTASLYVKLRGYMNQIGRP